MRIMITGGGTGGHTSPAVAVIEELRRRDPQLILQWVGRHGNIEERVSRATGVPFRPVPVIGWPRKRGPRQAWAALTLARGVLRAAIYLHRFKPDIVFGVGGYVCLPLMLAAQRLGYPTMLHESNKRMGMANRMLSPRATRVFLSFEDCKGPHVPERSRLSGNPVRSGFATPPGTAEAREALSLDPARPVVLIVGGSQGAQSINAAVTAALPQIDPRELQLLWMCGQADAKPAQAAAASAQATVHAYPFIDDIVTACAAADLIVARAGASTTAELALLGKAAILIPYPHATDNHQHENALAFQDAGAAWLLEDILCDGATLLQQIRDALADPQELARRGEAAKALAKPAAAEAIVEEMMIHVFGEAKAAIPET